MGVGEIDGEGVGVGVKVRVGRGVGVKVIVTSGSAFSTALADTKPISLSLLTLYVSILLFFNVRSSVLSIYLRFSVSDVISVSRILISSGTIFFPSFRAYRLKNRINKE